MHIHYYILPFRINSRSKVKCKLEDHLIDLTKHVWNMTIPTEDVIDILPSVVSVKRCGGNCARTSHRCIPSQTRNRSIPGLATSYINFPVDSFHM